MRALGLKVVLWADNDSPYYENDNLLHLKELVDVLIINDVLKMRNYL